MKHKIILCTLGLSLLLFSGCAQQQRRMEYIGADSAKQAALTSAGLSSSDVEQLAADLSSSNGIDYYHITFTANGQNYSYSIDALTGTVIGAQAPADGQAAPSASAETQASDAQTAETQAADAQTATNTQTDANAQAAASTQAAAEQSSQSTTPVQPPAQAQAQSSANAGTQAKAQTSNTSRQSSTSNASGNMITADQAKEKALSHAGLSADQVTFVKSHADRDDGRQVYDVEFYTSDFTEYDYEIDAYTGDVLSYDFDAEHYVASAPTNGSTLTAEEAKALVLEQVPGAAESDIWEFGSDYDDGRMTYEGTLIYGGTEYEFEIDAYSGAFRSWETEPIGRW